MTMRATQKALYQGPQPEEDAPILLAALRPKMLAIAARIQAHYDAGADHVCIQPFRPDGQPGPDLRLLEALAPRPS